MKTLVLNAGSSTVKYQIIDMDNEKILAKGLCERIGIDGRHTHKVNGESIKTEKKMDNHLEAIKEVLKIVVDEKYGVVKSLDEIGAVGHRVLHGGEVYKSSVVINDEVMENLRELIPLGPLHQPANIQGIEACKALMPNVPQVAVFDTSFHATMPDYAFRYAIPKEAYTKWSIRRYGFHGTSHRFVSAELEKIMGKKGKFIICHIGNGASVSAVKNGECQDTSMGYTPLEGLVMGSRSGDLDPAILERIMKETGMTIAETINYLNKKSGLLGVSCVSEDMRDLETIIFSGEQSERAEDSKLAIAMHAYRVRKYIGSYMAVLGGCDAIAFTAGVGENGNEYREQVLEGLEDLGIVLDKDKNGKDFKRGQVNEISSASSKVKIYVIPTDEELMIARDSKKLIEK
ncbi:MAG: acetate kinase [Clostridia bacterium]|nr:acetate kinase [Clostridia bacterium]